MCADTAVACQREPRESSCPRLGITDHSREPLPYFRGWEYQTVSWDMIAVLYRTEAARDVSCDALRDWYAQEVMGRTVDVSAGASVRMSLELSDRVQ